MKILQWILGLALIALIVFLFFGQGNEPSLGGNLFKESSLEDGFDD